MNKNFIKDSTNKIEQQINKIIPLIVVISTVIAISIYFSPIPIIYMYIDLVIALIFLILSIFQNRIILEIKFYIMIFVAITLSILVFFDGGISSGFIILLTIGNIIPILLINKKESLIVNITSIIILTLLAIWGTVFSDNLYINIGIAKWITHILMFLLFFIFFRIIFYNIIDALSNYLEIINENNIKISDLAYYDNLTKLPNQIYFKSHIQKRSENITSAYIVIYYIKNLAFINSLYGKEMGDFVIKELAKTLQNNELKLNLLSKTAGSELTLWIENISKEDILNYLNRIDEIIENKYKIHKLNHKLDIYIRFIRCEDNIMSPIDYYNKANIAMSYLKRTQNLRRIEYNSELEELIRFDAQLNNLLEEAIENKEFTINYQTKVLANNTNVIGAEALARWNSPIVGRVSPAVFVPKIEEIEKAVQFGEVIIEKVFQEYQSLCEKYNTKLKVSINISPSHLLDDNFIHYLKEKMNEYKIDGNSIIIEITEEVIILGIVEVNNILSEIRDLGISVSIDDFGTGYSSFNYLENLEVDEIKIDKSFIDKINVNNRSLIVVENIINLAKQLDLSVVAEGVETKEQYDKLLKLNCDIIQGYYFSKPEPLNN